MIRHLNRKIKCIKNMDAYKYLDDEIYELSLTLHRFIDSDKEYKCENCNKFFTRQDNLKKHFRFTCKPIKEVVKQNIIKIDKNTNISNISNITNISNISNISNITNQTNIETNNNIIIINPTSLSLKSFDEKWTTEHIDKYIKQLILLSEHKYTNLLTEILKNKENLNVIIDKDSKYGLVYKNNSELFVNMKTKEIIDKSMEKLYEQLTDFYNGIINNNILELNTNLIENEKKKLDNKFKDFYNNTNLKDAVGDLLTNIYDKNKLDSLEVAEKVIEYSKNMDNQIGF
jgi:hypothetical protein